MDKKQSYIQREMTRLKHSSLSLLALAGVGAILSLSILDYFVVPENFAQFAFYRLIAASFYLALYFLLKIEKSKNYLLPIYIISALVVSTMVEVMVLSFGGHQSSYYAGMIIVFVFLFGFLPLSLNLSLVIAGLIYAIYVVPILTLDKITNVRIFLNNNIFLLAAISGGLIWRYFNYNLLIKNLSLQYDLEEQKKQLQVYSFQLEGMVQDRTKELNKSVQWYQAIFDNSLDGVIVLNKEGIIVNANDRACQLHGFSKEVLVGTHIRLLEAGATGDKMTEKLQRILREGSATLETVHNKKDGSTIYLEINSKTITIGDEVFVQSFYRDITEKKRMQQHLVQSQKMESIGILAGGIAHDFNNILAAVLGHSEIIRRNAVLEEKATHSLNVVEDASRRASNMIQKLLGFARKSNYEMNAANINDVVYDAVKLLEKAIDRKIDLSVELDNTIPLIIADSNQLEQVVMNLIVNARDAMPEGGRIVIKSSFLQVGKNMSGIPSYIAAGEYVILTVSDTGKGIPVDIREKIFEPFFTTKEKGKGTGLGLSMVYGAVKEHKGYVTVDSELGEGAVFTVYLPVTRRAAAAMKWPAESLYGDETILVVDDEEHILSAVQDPLERHGYTVLATTDPYGALDMFQKMHDQIALVMTDIVMPRMDGRELIKQIKRINKKTKILAVSGYTKYVADKEEIAEKDGFLQKPFESHILLSTIRRVLDKKENKNLML